LQDQQNHILTVAGILPYTDLTVMEIKSGLSIMVVLRMTEANQSNKQQMEVILYLVVLSLTLMA